MRGRRFWTAWSSAHLKYAISNVLDESEDDLLRQEDSDKEASSRGAITNKRRNASKLYSQDCLSLLMGPS